MNRPSRLAFWPALLALGAVVLIPTPGAAEETRREFLQGTHAFRFYMHERDLKPLSDFHDLSAKPAKSILIVLGDTRILDDNAQAIQILVNSGCALLVATDHAVPAYRTRRRTWAGTFGLQIEGQPVLSPPDACYQQNEQCPWILPLPDSNPPLFAKLDPRVAANRAGYLSLGRSPSGRSLSELARFPERSWHNGIFRPHHAFAAGGAWGTGRVLFLADHSVFINNMMLQPDTGNASFACDCLDWLRGEEGRDRVLFYDEGKVVTNFNVLVVFPPLAMPPDPVALVNEAIIGLERENMHNKFLEQYVGYDRLLKWTTIGMTTLLAVYLLLRLVRSGHHLDTAAPLLAPTLARLAPVHPGIVQRHGSLLAKGNLWEPARALARDFFETALGNAEPPTGPEPPPFQSSDSWLARRFLERLVRHLWRLAYGATPERIAPAAFAHLAAQVDELKAALADGSLRFQRTGTT
jgi:hypothetical protein